MSANAVISIATEPPVNASDASLERASMAGKWLERSGCLDGDVVLLSGSAGLGIADQSSDVDIFVFTDREIPSDPADALPACEDFRLTFQALTRRGGVLQRWSQHGILVDVERLPKLHVLDTLERLLVRHDPDATCQKVARGLLDAVPLSGASAWQDWCTRLSTYPDGLARAMIRSHLALEPLRRLRARTLEREDPLAFGCGLAAFQLHVLGLLAGLNRYLLPAAPGLMKHTRHHLARMRWQPPGLERSLSLTWQDPCDSNLSCLEQIAMTVLDEADARHPEISTARCRCQLQSGTP